MNENEIRPYFYRDLKQKQLSPGVEYPVQIVKIKGNGILHCIFDGPEDRDSILDLVQSIRFCYQKEDVLASYRKKAEDLTVGEICVARFRRPIEIIKKHGLDLDDNDAYEHHRTLIARIIKSPATDKDKNDIFVEVNFVDSFRPSLVICLHDLYHIDLMFLMEYAFAVKCQLAGVDDLENQFEDCRVVERVLAGRPYPLTDKVVMKLNLEEEYEDGDDPGLPLVDVKIPSKNFDLKEYILENLDVLEVGQ